MQACNLILSVGTRTPRVMTSVVRTHPLTPGLWIGLRVVVTVAGWSFSVASWISQKRNCPITPEGKVIICMYVWGERLACSKQMYVVYWFGRVYA